MPLVSMPSHTFVKPAYAVTAGVQLFRGGRATAASSRPRWAVMRPLLALVATLLLVAVVPASASASMEPGEPVADPNVDGWLAIAHGPDLGLAAKKCLRLFWLVAHSPTKMA
jgi:hypothetical protein